MTHGRGERVNMQDYRKFQGESIATADLSRYQPPSE